MWLYCTNITKEPIAPGAKGVIGVQYVTDRVGAFTKQLRNKMLKAKRLKYLL
jgi:hypothetical protein